jgi:hypothetical protein
MVTGAIKLKGTRISKRMTEAACKADKESGVRQSAISVSSATEIGELLRTKPRVIYFGGFQSYGERMDAIGKLTQQEQEAVLDILVRHILDGYEVSDTERPLKYLMQPQADTYDELVCSSDWRLRIFEGPKGVLFDFNGWPGDNECGAGVYHAADKATPIDVFGNGDEDLVPNKDAPETLNAIIEEYSQRRHAANRTKEATIVDKKDSERLEPK